MLLAPFFFYTALGVAAATVALHFIVTRQPTSSPLPTVRFAPRSRVRVVTLEWPRDLILLILRALLILLIGLAFARPVLVPERRPVARIVVADRSSSSGDIEEVRDSVRALLGPGDFLVAFDTEARVVRREASDSIASITRSSHYGRLSTALIAAFRSAAELRAEADSIEIAIVSAFQAETMDAATLAIRELWPGRIRLVQLVSDADSLSLPPGVRVHVDADDDGVAIAARLAGLTADNAADESSVRIVRGEVSSEDSLWATQERRTLVHWPAEGAPVGWTPREKQDSVGALIAGGAAFVYPLERGWKAPTSSEVRVIARWADGEPAAVERANGEGCLREVAIPVPERGDVVFRTSFGHLVHALSEPCGGTAAGSRLLDEDELANLAGDGPLAARDSIQQPEVVTTPLVPWIIVLALALALIELWVRRGEVQNRLESKGEAA